MAINYARKRRTADRMVRKWGGPALLRRTVSGSPSDRSCTAAIINYTWQERGRGMFEVNERRALVSALAPDGTVLSPPPDNERDQLVVLHKTTLAELGRFRFTRPPAEIAPDSTTVILYDMTVSK